MLKFMSQQSLEQLHFGQARKPLSKWAWTFFLVHLFGKSIMLLDTIINISVCQSELSHIGGQYMFVGQQMRILVELSRRLFFNCIQALTILLEWQNLHPLSCQNVVGANLKLQYPFSSTMTLVKRSWICKFFTLCFIFFSLNFAWQCGYTSSALVSPGIII